MYDIPEMYSRGQFCRQGLEAFPFDGVEEDMNI